VDEIHTINNESGEIWEYVLLLLSCPIIGLSATVGNPHEFYHWLVKKKKKKKKKLKKIFLFRKNQNRSKGKIFTFWNIIKDTTILNIM
jgi:replicative superfamily II helicase